MKQKTVRLFFALWPDEEIRKQLMFAAKGIKLQRKGRLMRQCNLHMTLHFIGNTSLENAQCLEEKASAVMVDPFILQLNRTGEFTKPGIVWLGCTSFPRELSDLHVQLEQHISDCDFTPEKRRFRPHVTLYRKAAISENTPEILPIDWNVKGFSLIRSEQDRQDVIYREIRNYPFMH
jgi:2'-5' RNA ligase